MRIRWGAPWGLLAGVLLAGCGAGESGSHSAASAATGATLYAAHCAACHGARGEGQPDWRKRRPDGKLPAPPHDDGGHTWHHPPAQLLAITKYGMVPPNAPAGYASDMPAFGREVGGPLSDEEIRAVLTYIAGFWSKKVRETYRERFGDDF